MVVINNKNDALEFLRAHQPMPNWDDDVLVDNMDDAFVAETLDGWDYSVEFFTEYPCEEAIPLVLNSFGGGDGYGCYQHAVDMLEKFPIEVVLPYLTKALNSVNMNGKWMVALCCFNTSLRDDWDHISLPFEKEILSHVDRCVKVLVEAYQDGDTWESLNLRGFILPTLENLDEKGFVDWEQHGATIEQCRELEVELYRAHKRVDRLKDYETIIARHRG